MSSTHPAPAWYPDPSVPGQLRWWDGNSWTAHVAAPTATFGEHPNAWTQARVPTGPGGTPYASFGSRAGALLLDSVILITPIYLTIYLLAHEQIAKVLDWKGFFDAFDAASKSGSSASPPRLGDYLDRSALAYVLLVSALVGLVITGAYAIGLVGRYGRTLGQRAVGISVVDVDGAVPGYGRAARRWALLGALQLTGAIPFVGSLTGILLLVDYLSMLWSDQRQCWHDRIGQTWVVKTRTA